MNLSEMSSAIIIEQIGSAMCQSKNLIKRLEIITPTLPSVSAKMCKKTPWNIWSVVLDDCALGPSLWPWSWECPWSSCSWECPWWWWLLLLCVTMKSFLSWPPWEWPWCMSPPCWNTNIPIKLTIKPSTEMTSKRSWCISGGSNTLWKAERKQNTRNSMEQWPCLAFILTSIASERIKNAMNTKNKPFTKPAKISARTYLD